MTRKYLIILFLLTIISQWTLGQGKDGYDFVVSQNGDGDFTTVQAAINAIPDFRKKTTTIFIKNGIYKEKIILPASKNRVTLVGESARNS